MGKCGSNGCRAECSLCPFRPKVGCCDLIEFSDRGIRTAHFAALLLQRVIPGWNPKLTRFLAFTAVARDITESANCLRDFQELYTGDLFESDCHSPTAQKIDLCASGAALMSSGFTLVAILNSYGLHLWGWGPGVEKLARAVNATGHITMLVALLVDRAAAEEVDEELCMETTKKAVFQLAEAAHQSLVEGLEVEPLPLQCGIAIFSGLSGMVKVTTGS